MNPPYPWMPEKFEIGQVYRYETYGYVSVETVFGFDTFGSPLMGYSKEDPVGYGNLSSSPRDMGLHWSYVGMAELFELTWNPVMCERCRKCPAVIEYFEDELTYCDACMKPCDCCGFNYGQLGSIVTSLWRMRG